MRALRSWPQTVPTGGRNYVVDTLPKLVLDGYDYAPLLQVAEDVLLLEWDVAVAREDLDCFIRQALADPGRVLVAPYRLYITTVHGHPLKQPVWAHRRTDGSHVQTGEPTCAYFGFGMAYLPRALIERFGMAWSGHFSDGSFSGWHRREVTDRVPICWDVRPVHLHYPLADLGTEDIELPRPVVLTHMPNPDADERRAEQVADGQIAGLLRERAWLMRRGKLDRIAAVNEQLALRGYKEESDG